MAYRLDCRIFIGPFFKDYGPYIKTLMTKVPSMSTRGFMGWSPDRGLIPGKDCQYLALGFCNDEDTSVLSTGGFSQGGGRKKRIVLTPEEYMATLLPNSDDLLPEAPHVPPEDSRSHLSSPVPTVHVAYDEEEEEEEYNEEEDDD